MKNEYEILANIPHERIQSKFVRAEEQFDVFKLGVFRVTESVISGVFKERSGVANEIVELVQLKGNSVYKPHYHENSAAVIYMILGDGDFILGDTQVPYSGGMRFDIPKQVSHGFNTRSDTLFLSIQTPPIRDPLTGDVDLHYVD